MKNIFLIFTCLILFSITAASFASYVKFSIGSRGVADETTSYEYFNTGDGSFSYYRGPVYPPNYPYYYTQFSSGLWVAAANGDVPYNAFVDHYINGKPIYRCRSYINNRLIEGNLVPGEGCYVQFYNNVIRVTVYDVLLR